MSDIESLQLYYGIHISKLIKDISEELELI